MLTFLLFGEMKEADCWRTMSSSVAYACGPSGGAILANASSNSNNDDDGGGGTENDVDTESKIVGLLDLLMAFKDNELVGHFFVSLLEQLTLILDAKQVPLSGKYIRKLLSNISNKQTLCYLNVMGKHLSAMPVVWQGLRRCRFFFQ